MIYRIRLGVPEFKKFYDGLVQKAQRHTIDKDETRLFKQITKAMGFLSTNPRHNSLNSHEIDELSDRYSKVVGYKCKVFQSYLENNTPGAGRLYWTYGPGKAEMTIIGLEPHPENRKKAGYAKVSLSNLPPIEKSDIVS
jgi:hypothetical protein